MYLKEEDEQVSIKVDEASQRRQKNKRENQMNCINKIKILISCVLKCEKLDYFTRASI